MGLFSGIGKLYTGLLGRVSGGVGSLLNNLTGVTQSQDRTYAQQLGSMGVQNAYNNEQWLKQVNYEKEMWNLQNQYNSPVAQLARMRDAGIDINPTSYALGTGNLSNTAALLGTDVPMSASGFSGSGSPAGNPISQLMGMASGIQGIRESKARTDNLHVQNRNLSEVTDSTALENQIKRYNLRYAEEHGLPYGNQPSWDSGIGSALNASMKWFKDKSGQQINLSPDKGPDVSILKNLFQIMKK